MLLFSAFQVFFYLEGTRVYYQPPPLSLLLLKLEPLS